MKAISPFGFPIGLSVGFWSLMGLCRYIAETYKRFFGKTTDKKPYHKKDIAAILPAHNEEGVITSAIEALLVNLKPKQVYVASDGSSDKTTKLARKLKVHVSDINPGIGKGKALVYLINKYKLYERYKLIFIIDADTQVDRNFIPEALNIFKDTQVAVVWARPQITWKPPFIPNLKYYFISYRERLNRLLWLLMIYGQTWHHTNTMYVIPGYCTIYRTDVLSKLEIDTPGLLIEDFNLAFQLHKKKLGKIGHAPSLIGWDQHPDNLPDYWKQVKRWSIGFFQTLRKNGIWIDFFWVSMIVFTVEVTLNSMFTLFLPLFFLYLLYPAPQFRPPFLNEFVEYTGRFGFFTEQPIFNLMFNVFVIDYIFTVIIAAIYRKPQLLFYGLFFFPMHWITSLILVSSFIPGFFSSSAGRWISPKRQEVAAIIPQTKEKPVLLSA